MLLAIWKDPDCSCIFDRGEWMTNDKTGATAVHVTVSRCWSRLLSTQLDWSPAKKGIITTMNVPRVAIFI